MAGRLSFSIAINLLTENFKKGTNNVKNGFRSMQMQVLTFAAALGVGGLGLSDFVSRLITVARETSRVTTALKNVSGSLGQFADNQRFLLDMAKKYGLEINALTGNFAKFTAASQVSGMSMMNQRKIFESVSRACTAFGMSADDSNGVFLALSQMMSKGKISSEELRLQMGERLPIALQAMAKAVGVSVAGLDKLMKKGKLMSKDVLPRFADALKEMIPNVDTDNLETSINRLKNVFTEFTKGTGIQGAYKGIIDWLTGAVTIAGENIKNIVIGVVAVISGLIAKSVVGWWSSISSLTVQLEAASLKTNAALLTATKQRIAAEVALDAARSAALSASGSERIAAEKQVLQAELNLKKAASVENKAIENSNVAAQGIADAEKIASAKTTTATLLAIQKKRASAVIELENATSVLGNARTANSKAASYEAALIARAELANAEAQFSAAEVNLAKLTTKEIEAAEAAKVAAGQAASVKSSTAWGRTYTTMKVGASKLIVSLKSMWSAFAPMIIVTGIVAIVGKFKAMYDEAKRIRSIFSDYKKESQLSGYTQEVVTLKQQLKIMNDKKQSQENINGAQAQLQKMLGVEHKSQEELNKLVAKRVELLKETARADFYARKQVEFEDKNREFAGKMGLSTEQADRIGKLNAGRDTSGRNNIYYRSVRDDILKQNGKQGPEAIKAVEDYIKEYAQNMRVIADSSAELEKSTVNANKLDTTPVNDPADKKKKTELQKQEESYNKQLGELKAKLEISDITQAEYNKALGELNIKMYAKAKGSGDEKVLESDYYKLRKEAAEKAVKDQDKANAAVELEKVQKYYADKIKELASQKSNGVISEKEYKEELRNLTLETAKSSGSISGIGIEGQAYIAALQFNAKMLEPDMPNLEKRDTTYDYKKSKADIAGEELEVAKKNLEKLKEAAKGNAEQFSTELNAAMQNVTSLEEALKIATVMEDVKKLKEELSEGMYSGVKDIASSADRLVSSFQALNEAFDPDSEASGWERLMAVWSAMTNVVDSFLSVAKMMENLTELTNKLILAKQTEATIDTALTGTKVANAATQTTATTTALATQTTAEVAASATKSTAASVEMAAKSTAAYAAIPFVGVGLAAAQIAAMEAMIMAAGLPKFANGGIVSGGPTSGDKILARVNAGEMILNAGQQSRLFEAINSGRLGSASGVVVSGEAKLRGDTAFLQLSNYMKRTGKRLP